MIFRKRLSKKADIFVKSKLSSMTYYKPFEKKNLWKILLSSIVIFLGAITFLTTQPQRNTLLASHVLQAETVDNRMPWGNSDNDDWKRQQYANQTPVTISPFPQIQQQVPATLASVSPVPSISPINQPGGQDIGSISDQIGAIQQQISQQMQSCVANAQQMANQISQQQSQQKQIQSQLDAVNNQTMPNFDTSTTQGQQQQQAWQQKQQQQQQQLQSQIDALSTTISNAQTDMSNANSQCQQNVSQLEQNRGQRESDLDTAFSNAMNIQMPNQ